MTPAAAAALAAHVAAACLIGYGLLAVIGLRRRLRTSSG